jgi:hypothetical protein
MQLINFKWLLILLPCLCNANWNLGLKGGINKSCILSDATISPSLDNGFSGGFYFTNRNQPFGLDILYNRYGCNEQRTYSTDYQTGTGYYITRLKILSVPAYLIIPIKKNNPHHIKFGMTNNFIIEDKRIEEYPDVFGPLGCVVSPGEYGTYYPDIFIGYQSCFYEIIWSCF